MRFTVNRKIMLEHLKTMSAMIPKSSTVPELKGFLVEEFLENSKENLEEAMEKVTEAGLNYTTKYEESATVEEGKVIKSKPKAGSTRKKGDTITIVESAGGTYHYLENYVGLKYTEVKAKLEELGLK